MRQQAHKQGFEFKLETTVARRLALRVAFFGVLLFVLTFSILIPLQIRAVRVKTAERAYGLAGTIASLYQVFNRGQQIDKASQLLLEVAHMPSVASVGFLNKEGKILYSTDYQELVPNVNFPLGFFKSKHLFYVTHEVDDPRGRITSVLLAMDLSVVYADYVRFYIELAFGILFAILLLTFVVWWMAHQYVGRRLANLAQAMGNAEKGSFLVRGQLENMDEIGSVTLAFNKLLAAITNLQVKDIEREQDLKSAKEQLTIKDELEETAKQLNSSNKNLKRRIKAQELLMDAAHHLGGVLSKDSLVDKLVSLVRDKLGWPDFAIFLVEKSEDQEDQKEELHLKAASGLPDIEVVRSLVFQFGEGITGLVGQTATPRVVNDIANEKRIQIWSKLKSKEAAPDFLKKGSMLSVPMSFQGKVIGVMDFFYPKLNAFDEEDITLLHALGALAGTAIVNADLYEATLELATLDSLTGVQNRRSLEKTIENEIARAQRFSTPLSLLLIDVDNFKNYNDQMGHLTGDKALKEVATCLKGTVRKVDSVARYGGEEFCVVLPQTDEQSANEVALKLCQAIKQLNLPGAGSQPLGFISVSIGVAVYPDNMAPILEQPPMIELIHAADEALYVAKRRGRNRVISFSKINE